MAEDDVMTSPPSGAVDAQHSEAQEAELKAHYDQLLPEANLAYINYFLAHTPARWQEDIQDLVQEGLMEEARTMVKNNIGAPPSQIVDVDAVAQAAAHTLGAAEAFKIRDEANAVASSNPANPRFPLVNIEPGETGPIIVGSADEALRGPAGGTSAQQQQTAAAAAASNEAGNTAQPGGVATMTNPGNTDPNQSAANYQTTPPDPNYPNP